MAWLHIQDSPGSGGVGATSGGTSQTAGAFASPVTINNYAILFAWGNSNSLAVASNITGTDNGATPNTYTQLIFNAVTDNNADHLWAVIFVAKITSNPSSGNLNPKVVSSLSASGMVACASEFSGGSATTDGTNSATNVATGTPAPGSITTTNAADLLLAVMSSSSGTTTVTTPTGYTDTGKEITGASFTVGEGCWQIRTSTGSFNPTWNSQSNGWVACQAALQPAGAAFVGDEDDAPLFYLPTRNPRRAG